MEDYIGARVDYEPKYKDVLTYFQNIGNLYIGKLILGMKLVNRGQKYVTFMQGISGAEITFQGKDAQAFLSKLCMNNISKMEKRKK